MGSEFGKPFGSWIVPVCDVRPYLAACLDSVAAQTCGDWECVCVDDGSRDGSGALLDDYVRHEARFHAVHQRNAGVSSARNRALARVRGQWVLFLDGDDALSPTRLAVVQSAVCGKAQADWVRLACVNWDGRSVRQREAPMAERVLAVVEGRDVAPRGWELIAFNGIPGVNAYRADRLCGHRFDVALRMREDAIFSLSLLPALSCCVIVEDDGYLYRQREGSAFRRRQSVGDCIRFIRALTAQWRAQRRLCGAEGGRRVLAACATLFVEKAVVHWAANRAATSSEEVAELRRTCRVAWWCGALRLGALPWRRALRWGCFLLFGGVRALVPVMAANEGRRNDGGIRAVRRRVKRCVCGTRLGRRLYEEVYLPPRKAMARRAARRRLRKVGPEILRRVYRICEEEKIPCFVDYGTLLGCVRDHGFIRHDDDVDFGLLPTFTDAARLARRLMAEGFLFKRAFRYEGKITEIAFFYNRVSVDFFFNFQEGRRLWTHYYITDMDVPEPSQEVAVDGIVRTYRPLIPALKPALLGKAPVWIPDNCEAVLLAHYGKGWRIPNPQWGREEEGDYCVKRTVEGRADVIGLGRLLEAQDGVLQQPGGEITAICCEP